LKIELRPRSNHRSATWSSRLVYQGVILPAENAGLGRAPASKGNYRISGRLIRYCWRFGFPAVCQTETEEAREYLSGDRGAYDRSIRDDRKEANNSLLANDGDRDHLHYQGPARYSAV
ncbi:unnamed protein product, partial [Ectocarpus sp. 4 AP-2014]